MAIKIFNLKTLLRRLHCFSTSEDVWSDVLEPLRIYETHVSGISFGGINKFSVHYRITFPTEK